jgi:type II secretory pathway component PulF
VIGRLFYALAMRLPRNERMRLAKWRFQSVRETFYQESRLDIEATRGLRNRETLMERLKVLEERARKRHQIVWLAYQAIGRRMAQGDGLGLAMKSFIPAEEYALLDLASTSTAEDAARRGFELCEMGAAAKRILSNTTSLQMAYPVILLVYMYALCMLFGGLVYPEVVETRPVEQWTPMGQMLYAFDTFCFQYWWLTGSVMTALVIAYFFTLKRWTGNLRNRVDAAPLMWRNRRDLRAALLIVSLSGLFDSGLTLTAALERLKKNADPWLRWHLNRMGRRLAETPHEPMRSLDTGIFSEMIVDKIADANRRDRFIEAIKALGRNSLDRVVETVKRNARVTHYVLLGFAAAAFIGLGVGSYVVTGLVSLEGAVNSASGNIK